MSFDSHEARPFDLVEFATRRRVTIAMMTITLVLFGLIALNSLKVNLLPEMSYPTLTVRTEYTGAAPAEVETLISEPLEEALGVVKGLRKIKSISRTGQSDIVLEYAWGTNMDQAGLDVRDKLDTVQLPLQAKSPVILRFNPSTEPIVRLALTSSDTADPVDKLIELRRYADDDLRKKLEPVEGVAAVKIGGGLEDEIQIDLDTRKIAALHIPIETVISRLSAENVNLSAGRIEEGTQRYLVRTVNEFRTIDDLREMLVTTRAAGNDAATSAAAQMASVAAATGNAAALAAASNVQSANASGNVTPGGGMPIRLKDIAEVHQSYKERESIIRLDGRETVELAIYKEGDANTVATADGVHKRLEILQKEIPKGMQLSVIDDQSQFIQHAVNDVKLDAVIGGALAILIIFLFLRDGWSTFVVSLSLPVSIITTFFFMGQLGLSLNVMSLGGLALATGLVVDDSIVVLESIAKARERGMGVLEAAIKGTKEVSLAVMASTLTTIAVFLPLVFVGQVAGQLFRDQALTIAIAIAISLIVSMTLIPMLSALKATAPMGFAEEPEREPKTYNKPWQQKVARGGSYIGRFFGWIYYGLMWVFFRIWNGIVRVVAPVMGRASDIAMRPYHWLEDRYLRALPKALNRPTLVLGAAALTFCLSMLIVPFLGTDLIPQLAQDRFDMTVKLPPGTPLTQTDAVVKDIQVAHSKDAGVRDLYGVSGQGTRLDANPTESGENIGKISILMQDGGSPAVERSITEKMRASMRSYPNAQVNFSRPQLFSFSSPLEIEIRGDDLNQIQKAGQKMAAMLRAKPAHFADVKSTVEQGFPEIQIRFDEARAGAIGLTSRQIADSVVRQVRGEVATRYSFRDRKIDVLVRAEPTQRSSVNEIRNLVISTPRGGSVLLSTVADVVSTTGPSEIHRADQQRVAVISSNLRDIDLGAAVQEVNSMVAKNPLGTDVEMSIGGQGAELAESTRSLLFAFALAVFLVYLVMASQFESLRHPFVILFTIPLALVGAVLALFITRNTISVVVFIGLILLVGLVTKNAIILIDKVNQLRAEGVPVADAIVQGARSRLRPIIMTTACSLFGFLPLALATGQGSEVRSPMAITVIGGLLVSTMLTLFVIPVVYNLMERRAK